MRCRSFLYYLLDEFLRANSEPGVEEFGGVMLGYPWAWVDIEPLGRILEELMERRGDESVIQFGRYVYENIKRYLAVNGWFVSPGSILSLPNRIWLSCFDQGKVSQREVRGGFEIKISGVVLDDIFQLAIIGWLRALAERWGLSGVSLREEDGSYVFYLFEV